ncbi:MAG: MucB/RseB C-terminal domain-containing protein [Gammaproteobacteria bacterium]|nr:MucB/RseB C-terminal domain-containing protein [Gammaproteobacteria bacterium]
MPMSISYAADESVIVKGWLQKMIKAEHSASYRGTLVYRHQNEMVIMDIVRAKGEHGMMEYLSAQNGAPGEVIRNPHYVQCLIPDNEISLQSENPQVVNKAEKSLRDRIDEIGYYYQLTLAGVSRIAGRSSQKLVITPLDQYRYGYRMWIDQQSGLLLKSEHLAVNGEVLEQMIYSNIEVFGETIPLDVQLMLNELSDRATPDKVLLEQQPSNIHDTQNWAVKFIPTGFELASYRRSTNPLQIPFEHIVFSDGLAAVSVFIEKQEENGTFNGASQRGAMNAYFAENDGFQVVVVGEVPLETLELIGKSVHHTAASIH